MLSLSGLGLSFVSLWFCSEAQGRPHGEEDSHCSSQDSGVSQLAQTWPGSSPTVPMPHVSYVVRDAARTRPADAWPCLCRELWLRFGALAVSSGEHNMTTARLTVTAPGCRVTLLPAPTGLGHCGMKQQSGCLHTSPS